MKKKFVSIILCVAAILSLSACGCNHEWADATCTEPKTCTLCGETDGEAAGHISGNWVEADTDFNNAVKTSEKRCTVCDEALETNTIQMDKLYEGKLFLFTAEEFANRLNAVLDNLGDIEYKTKYVKDMSGMGPACIISNKTENIAAISMLNKYSSTGAATHGVRNITGMFCYFYSDSDQLTAEAMLAIVLACDPSMNLDDGRKCCSSIIENGSTGTSYRIDGLSYFLTQAGEDWILGVKIS